MAKLSRAAVHASLIDSLSDFIHKLNREENSLVVVEGPRDLKALRASGFHGEIFMLCHSQNKGRLEARASKYGKLILLLDYDAEGKKIGKKISKALEGKVKLDFFYRRRLLSASNGTIRHVEEFGRYSDAMAPWA